MKFVHSNVVLGVSLLPLLCALSSLANPPDECASLAFQQVEIPAEHDLLWNVVAGDLDGDLDQDLVVVGIFPYDYGIFSVRKNRGDGTFDLPRLQTIGGDPRCVVLEDLDHDFDLDLVVSNGLGGRLFVFKNSGDGSFDTPSTYYDFPADVRPFYHVTKDIDGDGSIDLAVSDGYGSVWILWNRGDGSFEYGPNYRLLPDGFLYEIIAEEFNGDNRIDLAVMAIPYDAPTYTVLVDEAKVFLLFNDGNRGFRNQTTFDIPDWPHNALSSADLDGDGDFDLAGVNSGNALPNPHGMWISLNDGQADFGEPIVYNAGLQPRDLHLGDIDGDGDLDAIIPEDEAPYFEPPNPVYILLNDGYGSFLTKRKGKAGFGPQSAVFTELNGDGRPDIVVANFSGYGYTPTLSILYNLCDADFDVDFDSDGDVDLLDHTLMTKCESGPSNPIEPSNCGAADFDADGHVDLSDWARFQTSFVSD